MYGADFCINMTTLRSNQQADICDVWIWRSSSRGLCVPGADKTFTVKSLAKSRFYSLVTPVITTRGCCYPYIAVGVSSVIKYISQVFNWGLSTSYVTSKTIYQYLPITLSGTHHYYFENKEIFKVWQSVLPLRMLCLSVCGCLSACLAVCVSVCILLVRDILMKFGE